MVAKETPAGSAGLGLFGDVGMMSVGFGAAEASFGECRLTGGPATAAPLADENTPAAGECSVEESTKAAISLKNRCHWLKSPPMKAIELIREFLHERLAADPAAVVPEAVLVDLGVDSLMMLELMFEFEDRFAIKLESDLKAPQTVGELATLMEALIAQQSAHSDSTP